LKFIGEEQKNYRMFFCQTLIKKKIKQINFFTDSRVIKKIIL
jgi:hypothetical protein